MRRLIISVRCTSAELNMHWLGHNKTEDEEVLEQPAAGIES
jgi:hypothetical protein